MSHACAADEFVVGAVDADAGVVVPVDSVDDVVAVVVLVVVVVVVVVAAVVEQTRVLSGVERSRTGSLRV
jgi:hypothetical protein